MASNNPNPPFLEALKEAMKTVSRHSPILQLDLRDLMVDITSIEINQLSTEHPFVRELKFPNCLLTVADAFMAIFKFKSLVSFQFRVKGQDEVEDLQLKLQHMNNGWTIEVTRDDIHDSMMINLSREV